MLSVQSPGYAGMDRLGGLGRGSALGGPGVHDLDQRELKEKHQQELSLIMERQTRIHSAQRCETLNYPPQIRLGDGEWGDRNLQLRPSHQLAELTRSYVIPPPNKSVCDVPGHKETCGFGGGPCRHGPEPSASCGPPYRSSSSGHLVGCSPHPGDLLSPLVPRSHSVSTPRDKHKEKSSASKKDNTFWNSFRHNVLGRFSGNGNKSNCVSNTGEVPNCAIPPVMVPVPCKQPMSVLVPVREKDFYYNHQDFQHEHFPGSSSPGSDRSEKSVQPRSSACSELSIGSENSLSRMSPLHPYCETDIPCGTGSTLSPTHGITEISDTENNALSEEHNSRLEEEGTSSRDKTSSGQIDI